MVFSSLMFLFRFMPLALLAYYIAPRFMKNGVLLLVSLIFYAWGEPKYVLIMFLSIAVDYIASNGMARYRESKFKKNAFMALSVATNMGLLLTFKYTNFFIENINWIGGFSLSPVALTLPLGISFYTFQTMSYSIDVFRGKVAPEKNLIDFGAYVCLFPQLIAGPIVKYVDVQRELKQRRMNLDQMTEGVRYFIMGLSSKVLIANPMGQLWNDVTVLGVDQVSTPLAWIGIIGFAFQIYFDFSGYSLMAIGLGKMLGFEFPKNFDFPYMSKSITEFWRRWHMTLGSWFREYVYIPLGGNRKGVRRQMLNLFIVWFLTGFWHGASWNFIFWGLYFALFLVVEKVFLLKRLERYRGFSHVYAMFVVLIGWVIFANEDLSALGAHLKSLFTLNGGDDYKYALSQYGTTLVLAVFFSTPIIKKIYQRLENRPILVGIGLMALFALCVAYLVDASFNPFLYFRF
ncbi:MBOAT family O-acyltransferase [Fusibacter sp. JL298sf-3]